MKVRSILDLLRAIIFVGIHVKNTIQLNNKIWVAKEPEGLGTSYQVEIISLAQWVCELKKVTGGKNVKKKHNIV